MVVEAEGWIPTNGSRWLEPIAPGRLLVVWAYVLDIDSYTDATTSRVATLKLAES